MAHAFCKKTSCLKLSKQSFRVAGILEVPGMLSACQLGLCADRTTMFCRSSAETAGTS